MKNLLRTLWTAFFLISTALLPLVHRYLLMEGPRWLNRDHEGKVDPNTLTTTAFVLGLVFLTLAVMPWPDGELSEVEDDEDDEDDEPTVDKNPTQKED